MRQILADYGLEGDALAGDIALNKARIEARLQRLGEYHSKMGLFRRDGEPKASLALELQTLFKGNDESRKLLEMARELRGPAPAPRRAYVVSIVDDSAFGDPSGASSTPAPAGELTPRREVSASACGLAPPTESEILEEAVASAAAKAREAEMMRSAPPAAPGTAEALEAEPGALPVGDRAAEAEPDAPAEPTSSRPADPAELEADFARRIKSRGDPRPPWDRDWGAN